MRQILIEYKHFLVLAHIFATTLGLGGAIVTDMLFMRFLKDYRVSAEEKETLDVLSWIIWCGLGLLVLTGFALFWPIQGQLLQSPNFLTKMTAVSVILINGLVLNFYISPKLTAMVFNDPTQSLPSVNRARKLSPIFGGISISSWSTAFFIGAMSSYLDYSLQTMLLAYGAWVLIAVCGSLIVTKYKFRQRN